MPDLDIDAAADEVTRLLDAITPDQLGAPTPCEGSSVATLLDHLMGLCLAFTWAARKSDPPAGVTPGPGQATAEHLDPALARRAAGTARRPGEGVEGAVGMGGRHRGRRCAHAAPS